jgi:hypothetical protein
MLTNSQMNDSRRHHTLEDFFTDHAATVASYVPLQTEVTKHAANVAALDALAPLKDVVTRGITLDKKTLKHNIAFTASIICDKARAFGLSFGQIPLAEEMRLRADLIENRNDEDFLPFIQHINDVITPFLADVNFIPYGVTAGDLSTLLTDAATFDGMIGLAGTAKSTAQVANVNVDALLDGPLRQNLIQFDLLVKHFSNTDPDFVKGYYINAAVDDLGVHHNGIEGVIVGPTPPDDPAALPKSGVTVKILGTNKVALTNVLGHYSIVRVKSGDYNVEVSKPGYKTITQTVKIKRGQILDADFTLMPS